MYKKTGSKKIFSHQRITLIEDDIILPNGKESKYLLYEEDFLGGVDIILKGKNGKFLLQKEYSYPINEKIFQFPGGRIEKNEDIEAGAVRELGEETKISPRKISLIGSYLLNNRRFSLKMFVFLAEEGEKSDLGQDEEEFEIEKFWFEESEIDTMISDGKIIHSHTLASWAIYKSKKDK